MNSPQNVWGISDDVIKKAKQVHSMKHGLFASVPIICKDLACPYKDVCTIDIADRHMGSRCPMEAAAIVSRFETWCRHFKIDIDGNKIKDEDIADVSLIKDLVENEVQTIRAENRIAMTGDFIGKTIVEVDKNCTVHEEDTVTPEAEFKLSLQEKRYKILTLLNATRKDKVNTLNNSNSASGKMQSIFEKVNKIIDGIDIDNIDFDESEEETEEV